MSRCDAGNGVVVGDVEGLHGTLRQSEFEPGYPADALLEPQSLHPCDVLEQPEQCRR